MAKTHKSYKTLIPKHLHPQVEKLLDYLTYHPYGTPTECPHCSSKKFHKLGRIPRLHGDTINPQYHCTDCQSNFTQLTNTIFTGTYYLELWGELGKLYLSGLSRKIIYTKLSISTNTCYRYTKKINAFMQEKCPELYEWWHTHQFRKDLTFTAKIEQQANTFYDWLDHLINHREYNCPQCAGKMYKKDYKTPWPRFVCYPCKKFFNALDGTYFRGMLYIELWPKVAKHLIKGSTDTDIYRLYGIQTKTVSLWRKRFTEQMKALNLMELVQWVEWQSKRRLVQTKKHRYTAKQNIPKNKRQKATP